MRAIKNLFVLAIILGVIGGGAVVALRVARGKPSAPAVNVTDPMVGVVTVDLGGGKTVKAIPVPGHTPGSYVFLYDGVLFSGDAMVFKQGRLDRAPKFFDADPDGAKTALVALKQQLAGADVDVVCTGHGGCTPKGLGKNLFDDLLGRI